MQLELGNYHIHGKYNFKSELSYEHLQLAHRRDPVDVIRLLLSEKRNNKTRVTKSNAVIEKINQHFNTVM